MKNNILFLTLCLLTAKSSLHAMEGQLPVPPDLVPVNQLDNLDEMYLDDEFRSGLTETPYLQRFPEYEVPVKGTYSQQSAITSTPPQTPVVTLQTAFLAPQVVPSTSDMAPQQAITSAPKVVNNSERNLDVLQHCKSSFVNHREQHSKKNRSRKRMTYEQKIEAILLGLKASKQKPKQ